MTSYARPIKVGGNQNYVDEVASGYPKLPAKELDDDFNILYDAVNRPMGGAAGLADRTVSGVKLILKTVTRLEIADKTITGAQIADSTITSGLLDPAIVLPIADGVVTNPKLANGAVTDIKVTDVSWAKITSKPLSFPPSGSAGGDLIGTYPNPTLKPGLIPTTLPPNGAAGGSLAGTYPNPSLAASSVGFNELQQNVKVVLPPTPTMPTDASKVLTVTPGTGALAWQTPSAGGATGVAGGSLAGTYPNPTIAANAVGTAQLVNASVNSTKLAAQSVSPANMSPGPGGADQGAFVMLNGPGFAYVQGVQNTAGISYIQALTQAAYDGIGIKNATTLYVITG